MLFELFLIVGIVILPISIAALLISIADGSDKFLKQCVIAIVVAIVFLLLAVTLPPIPIIPQ